MQFQLTILGCNSAIPANGRFPSAQVLQVDNGYYLIDCGEGTQIRLSENGISKSKINQIFISHLHGDHIFGLMGLLSTMSLMGRTEPLKIFSPAGLEEIISVQQKHSQSFLPFDIEFCIVDTRLHQRIFADDRVEVFSIPLDHRIPTSGYLFVEKEHPLNINPDVIAKYELSIPQIKAVKQGDDLVLADGTKLPNKDLVLAPKRRRSFAYCSDTTYQESIVPMVKGVDILYHESTFLHEKLEQAQKTKHSTALQAASIAAQAQVKLLILGHYSSRYKVLTPLLEEAKSKFDNVDLGIEGQTYTVK